MMSSLENLLMRVFVVALLSYGCADSDTEIDTTTDGVSDDGASGGSQEDLNILSGSPRPIVSASPRPSVASIGPFSPAPALSIYWINRPLSCGARVYLSTTSSEYIERAMLRVYQSSASLATMQENLQMKELIVFPKVVSPSRISEATVELPRSTLSGTDAITEIRLSTSTNANALQSVKATLIADCPIRDDDYGVSFQNGEFTSWGTSTLNLFAYVPYHAEILVVSNRAATGEIRVAGVNSSGVEDAASVHLGPVNSTLDTGCFAADAPCPSPAPNSPRFSAKVAPRTSRPIVPRQVSG